MDVDKTSFYPLLLDILTDISEAHFVAFDLELSGVPSKGSLAGNPTLQQRYEETKTAAETFQILQIGLTCVRQDTDNGRYVLKPYNFDLCPLISERGLDVERIFGFQSGAAEFLLRVGFDLNRPFQNGVPYLSTAEAKVARDQHARRQDKTAVADINLKPTEVESLAFLDRVRTEIKRWTAESRGEYCTITPDIGSGNHISSGNPSRDELSRLEKRLVHQLVRSEFPELVSIGRGGYVQIVRFNQQREERILAGRAKELEERIARQRGFEWIVRALYGSSFLDGVDLKEFAKDPTTGEPLMFDSVVATAKRERARYLTKGNPRVLVGHNCFLDLIYLYNTFVGPLPDTVEEFQSLVHAKWPMVIDTKYVDTLGSRDLNNLSSLEQIAQRMSTASKPPVETHESHQKYDQTEVLHEAGYDSFLTAQIAVRLSAKLFNETSAQFKDAAVTQGGDVSDGQNQSAAGLVSPPPTSTGVQSTTPTPATTKQPGFTPSDPTADWKRNGEPTLEPTSDNDPFSYGSKTRQRQRKHDQVKTATIPNGMPPFSSTFWNVYGNNLRVYGSQEGQCNLDASSGLKAVDMADAKATHDTAIKDNKLNDPNELKPDSTPLDTNLNALKVKDSDEDEEEEDGGIKISDNWSTETSRQQYTTPQAPQKPLTKSTPQPRKTGKKHSKKK